MALNILARFDAKTLRLRSHKRETTTKKCPARRVFNLRRPPHVDNHLADRHRKLHQAVVHQGNLILFNMADAISKEIPLNAVQVEALV